MIFVEDEPPRLIPWKPFGYRQDPGEATHESANRGFHEHLTPAGSAFSLEQGWQARAELESAGAVP